MRLVCSLECNLRYQFFQRYRKLSNQLKDLSTIQHLNITSNLCNLLHLSTSTTASHICLLKKNGKCCKEAFIYFIMFFIFDSAFIFSLFVFIYQPTVKYSTSYIVEYYYNIIFLHAVWCFFKRTFNCRGELPTSLKE